MLRLSVTTGSGEQVDHVVTTREAVIGRSSACSIVLHDASLSRRHARLYTATGRWMVEDLRSRNGTFVNGGRIAEPTPLAVGDTVTVGTCTITIHDRAPAMAQQLASGGETLFRPASDLLGEEREPESAAPADREAILRRSVDRLRLVNEIHDALARSITLDELLDLILERAFDHLRPEQGLILLKNSDGSYSRAASRSVLGTNPELTTSQSLIKEVVEKGLAALVLDAQTDWRFSASDSIVSAGVRSLVAAPLQAPDGAMGMIVLSTNAAVREFTEEDMALLVTLAAVAAMRIRNVALAEEAAERRRMEKELALARRIQTALLPESLPTIAGYQLVARNTPSRGVSGDFYQVMPRNGAREQVLFIADVSGKGIAASLLTASMEALAAAPIEEGHEPATIFERLSNRLCRRTPPEKFATALLVVLEPDSGALRYANAGHNPALVMRADGTAEWLEATGMPLGLLEEAEYEEGTTLLAAGDTLLLYTDGITEAANADDEEFGADRLARAASRARHAGAEAIADAVEFDLTAFIAGFPVNDDCTVVILRRDDG